jgi:hypothetical protein
MKNKSNCYHGLSGISPPDFPGALLSALTLDQITLFGKWLYPGINYKL